MKPNHVLIVGPPHSGKLRIAQHVTGDTDTSTVEPNSHSGLIYSHIVKTKYYELAVNLLVEEYPDSRISHEPTLDLLLTFAEEFLSDEYSELREALDGIVLTIDPTASELDLEDMIPIYEKLRDLLAGADAFCVVVTPWPDLVSLEFALAVEDMMNCAGLEFLNFNDAGENEFKEKLGKDRLTELFHSHEWTSMDPVRPNEAMNGGDSHHPKSTANLPDIGRLAQQLKREREVVSELDELERQSYVDDLVDEYMNYF